MIRFATSDERDEIRSERAIKPLAVAAAALLGVFLTGCSINFPLPSMMSDQATGSIRGRTTPFAGDLDEADWRRALDPDRGGAETYVVDLCHRLARLGHEVDVFANSWKPGALPPEVRTIKVEAHGLTRWQRTWDFATNSERAWRVSAIVATSSVATALWRICVQILQNSQSIARFPRSLRSFIAFLKSALCSAIRQTGDLRSSSRTASGSIFPAFCKAGWLFYFNQN